MTYICTLESGGPSEQINAKSPYHAALDMMLTRYGDPHRYQEGFSDFVRVERFGTDRTFEFCATPVQNYGVLWKEATGSTA